MAIRPRALLGSLQRSLDPLGGFKGAISRQERKRVWRNEKGKGRRKSREGKEKGREGQGKGREEDEKTWPHAMIPAGVNGESDG